jgi:hypothetical protein
MIKDIVKIHDKFSVEIKLVYDAYLNKKKPQYDVLTYLFIPNGLNINNQTYNKNEFYNDVRLNVRYNTPTYTLEEMIYGENNFIIELQKIITEILENPQKNNHEHFITQTKLFGSIFSSAIKNRIRLSRKNISENNVEELNSVLSIIKEVLNTYRAFVEKNSQNIDKTKLKLLLFTDEFISNIAEYNIVILYDYLKRKRTKINPEISTNLVKFVESETNYRKYKNYNTVLSTKINNETLLYNRSLLKKYIESVLFLKKEIRKDGTIIEQTLFAVVAGLAMVFSTMVAFYYQQKYGNFTLPFLIALVLSYMLKDRIKGYVGYLFVSKASSIFYDFKLSIYSSEKNKIGIIKENFRYTPFIKLGPKVKKHRLKDRLFENEFEMFGEHIIQYKKRIILFKKQFVKGLSTNNVTSLADITRINFHRYIQHMDDPQKDYYIINNGEIVKKTGDRVYHINIVQKFYTETGVEFKRFKVIMNRNGIKRIEKVELEKL